MSAVADDCSEFKKVADIVSPRANSSTLTRYCCISFHHLCGAFRITMCKESALLAINIASCLNLRRTIEIILKTVDSLSTIPIMRLQQDGAISSVGRASPLHGGGRRFEPVIAHHFGSLAQLVEQLTFNQLVAGSNPARPTNTEKSAFRRFFRICATLIPANSVITYFSVSCWMRTCVQVRAERSETTTHSVARRARPKAESILHDPPIQKKRLLALFSHLRPDNLYKPHHVRPAPENNHAPAPPIEKALQAAPLGYPGVVERIIRPPASPRRQSRYPAW